MALVIAFAPTAKRLNASMTFVMANSRGAVVNSWSRSSAACAADDFRPRARAHRRFQARKRKCGPPTGMDRRAAPPGAHNPGGLSPQPAMNAKSRREQTASDHIRRAFGMRAWRSFAVRQAAAPPAPLKESPVAGEL